MKFWLKALYIADKVANKLTGGKKWETISSRMGTCLESPDCPKAGKAVSRALCGMLNWVDKNHCHDSIEKMRAELALHQIKESRDREA